MWQLCLCQFNSKENRKFGGVIYFISWLSPDPPGGGTPGNSWWGCAARFSKSWPYFRPKNVIFHTCFQTRPLTSIPVFRPGLQAEIMLSLLRLERQQKNALNPFRIGTFLFLSYSFGIELINMFIHSRSSLENHTRFQTKMTNVCIPIPVFRPKRRKNPTRWGSTYLYLSLIHIWRCRRRG